MDRRRLRGQGRKVHREAIRQAIRRRRGEDVARRLIDQGASRQLASQLPLELATHHGLVDDPTDRDRRQLEPREDRLDLRLPSRLDDQQHPLLGFGEQQLERVHEALAAGHAIEVDLRTTAASGGQLGKCAGQTGRAQVLHRDHRVGMRELETRLHQQLLQEWVTYLDRRAARVSILAQHRAGKRGPRDPVATGGRTHQQERVARARGARQRDLIVAGDAQAHGVDQRIAAVRRVEEELAPDVGNADTVAVARDPRYHAVEQVPIPRGGRRIGPAAGILARLERAEPQTVQQGDGPGAHGEDVADDAADPGRGSLVRLDGTRVVVGFHLEDGRQPMADVEHPGVLARPDQDSLALGRQRGEKRPRVLVGAVLAPHGAEHRKLDRIGVTADQLDDAVVLARRQAVEVLRGRERV